MKTEILRDHNSVVEYLDNLSTRGLLDIHREYCQIAGYSDDEIHYNDEEFFSIFFSTTDEAIRAVCYGEYTYMDEYVKFNGYANLETTNDPSKWIDTSEIAEHILENEDDYSYLDFELIEEDEN